MRPFRHLALLSSLLFLGTNIYGQVFPITANVQLNPPTTTYLPEFSILGSDRLSVNLFFNDFNEPAYDVRLKISIEGNGISLTTHPSYMPPAITLSPGGNVFNGSDLANYLSPNNLLINGISSTALQQSGSGLPEGIYNFCVQVFDFNRPEVALSLNHCQAKLLRKNYPPNLVMPACGSTVPVFGGNQDILFQWHSNADFSIPTLYELSIVEVISGMNPDDAMNGTGTKILDSEPVMGTTFLYGPNQLPLELGKRYAWRIKTLDIQGNSTFENNGLSPVCTFYYGVDADGMVPLISPALEQRVSCVQQLTFQWERPANATSGQQVYYKLKIVRMLEGQDPEVALEYNPVWHEATTPVLPGNSAEVLPNSLYPLPPEENYAWEVKAYSDNSGVEQEIAVSEKRMFKSAPAVEKFKAGNPDPNMITVLTLTKNEDLPNFEKKISGVGTMQIRENGEEVTLNFNDIIVGPYSDLWQMLTGTIVEPLNNFIVHLDNSGNPSGDAGNMDNYGRADFDATHVIVEVDDLKLRGRIKWKFPHGTVGGNPVVQSEEDDVLYNRYKLIDAEINVEAAEFDLLDPLGFKIEYTASTTSTSNFALYDDILTLTLDGGLTTSEKIKNMGNQPIIYHFKEVDNPFYFASSIVEADDDFRINSGMLTQINPRAMTFDLSEDESPVGVADTLWKGMYFNDFVLRLPSNFDVSGKLFTDNNVEVEYIQNEDNTNTCFVDVHGITLDLFHDWDDVAPLATMNTFESNLYSVHFSIEKNQTQPASHLAGYFGLPHVSPYDYFMFKMDVSNTGTSPAYLEEDSGLKDFYLTLNEDEYIRSVAITIKQAIFVGGDHVQMTIDLEWPALDLEVFNIPNFNVWGNGNIGFNTPNGTQSLAGQANGYMPGNKTFEYTVESVGAIYQEEGHFMAMSVDGVSSSAENFAGPNGPSKVKIGSAKISGDAIVIGEDDPYANGTSGMLGADVGTYYGNGGWKKQIRANLGPTLGFNASIIYQADSEEWGDVWFGMIDIDFGIPLVTPTTYQFLAQLINGKKLEPGYSAPYDYWFFELGMGSIEKANATGAVIQGAKDAYTGMKNNAEIGKAKAASALETAGENFNKLATKINAKYAELTATDPDAEPGKFARLKGEIKVLSAKMKVKCKQLTWEAEKIYYGKNKTRNRSNAIVLTEAERVALFDNSGAWSTKLKNAANALKQKAGDVSRNMSQKASAIKNSSAYQSLGNLATDAKVKCISVATPIKNGGKWAGGKIAAGASFTGTKFKNFGTGAAGMAKSGFTAGKAKAAKLVSAMNSLPDGIPLGRILLTGVQGRIYYHMSHDVTQGIIKSSPQNFAAEATATSGASDPNAYSRMTVAEFPATTPFTYRPDNSTSLGIMLMANIESLEVPISGKLYRGYGAFEVALTSGGGLQSLGFETQGDFMNTTVPLIIDNALLKGYMNIGYHAPEKKFRAQGYWMTETNALCGVGDFDLSITPLATRVRIASPERKTFMLPGCVGFYGLGYMDYKHNSSSTTLDIGLGLGWQATTRYTINLVLAEVTPYATIGLEAGLDGLIRFEPTVGIERFGAWMSAWARVGVYIDWPWPVPNQDIGLGITIAGNVAFHPGSPWRASGLLKGNVEVVGLNFPFKVDFNEPI